MGGHVGNLKLILAIMLVKFVTHSAEAGQTQSVLAGD